MSIGTKNHTPSTPYTAPKTLEAKFTEIVCDLMLNFQIGLSTTQSPSPKSALPKTGLRFKLIQNVLEATLNPKP